MTTQADKARQFLSRHRPGEPLLLPNPWDLGSARLLASLGFEALATTSSGFAASLGRNDGSVSRDETLVHSAVIVAATDLPVSADLEHAFADEPAAVAETIRLAIEVGLAGGSVEDSTGREDDPIYDLRFAAERIAAAAQAAHAGPVPLIREVDRPVNVLAVGGAPPVPELAEAGASRISVGGAFAFAALNALVSAATELRDQGTYGYQAASSAGRQAALRAFG